MKKLLLILGFSLGLSNSVYALEIGDRHADPFKVITKGKIIDKIIPNKGDVKFRAFLEYQGELYECNIIFGRYQCFFLEPKIN